MVTPTSNSNYPPSVYQPDQTQQERAQSLRRFNWLAVYLPILLGGLATLIVIGLMIWGVFSPNIAGTAVFASGLADLTLILFMLPMMLLCVIGPAALIAIIVFAVQRRQKQKETPAPPGNRVQRLFWRVDNVLNTINSKTETTAPRIAGPIIRFNAWLAYAQTLLQRIKSLFR